MELLHTSPAPIAAINAHGRFGSFLFFSAKEYVMTAGQHVIYKIELDEADLIDAGRIFWHEDAAQLQPLVAELAERLGVDAEQAEALIEETASVFDFDTIAPEDAADAAWDVQLFTARAARILGFRAVRVQDEQGSAYMVDMLDHETELVQA